MKVGHSIAAVLAASVVTACPPTLGTAVSVQGPTQTSSTVTPANPTPLPNRPPVIKSLTVHRFAEDRVALWAQAWDPDCDPLKFTWSPSHGILSSTAGLNVDLSMAATSSAQTKVIVQVSVSDGRGGTAEGAVTAVFGPDGLPTMATEATASMPTPEPCTTPTVPPPSQASQAPSGGGTEASQAPSSGATEVPMVKEGFATVSGTAYLVKNVGYTSGNFAMAGVTISFYEHSFNGGDGALAAKTTTDAAGKYSVRLKTLQEYKYYGSKGQKGEYDDTWAGLNVFSLTEDKVINIRYASFD